VYFLTPISLVAHLKMGATYFDRSLVDGALFSFCLTRLRFQILF
jgi:hypothetical protein